MEMVYFTIVAVVLYFVTDRIVNLIEMKRGERLANRSFVFFVIIIILSMTTFTLIQTFIEKPVNTITSESAQTE